MSRDTRLFWMLRKQSLGIEQPSDKQKALLRKLGLPCPRTKREAGLMLDAKLSPLKCWRKLVKAIDKAQTDGELDAAGQDVRLVAGILPGEHRETLVEIGK